MLDIPLHERKFTLDDTPVHIFNFIEVNADGDPEAFKLLKSEISELQPTFQMCFGGGAVPVRTLKRIK